MRGSDQRSGSLFSYVDLADRVRADHPLRTICEIGNAALGALSGEFEAVYATGVGRPSIPSEPRLCFMGHTLMENRHGLVVDGCLTPATGHAERIAALHMIEPRADRGPASRSEPTRAITSCAR